VTIEIFSRVLTFSERVGLGRIQDARASSPGMLIMPVNIRDMHSHCMGDLIQTWRA
jgi:hypothetical protein